MLMSLWVRSLQLERTDGNGELKIWRLWKRITGNGVGLICRGYMALMGLCFGLRFLLAVAEAPYIITMQRL